MNKMKVALVGAGGVARAHHAPALARIPDVRLVAVCDIDEHRANNIASDYGATAYDDVETMLSAAQPDIVHVCTPETRHYEPVMAALEAGAHVFCEKIMAENSVKARAMVAKSLTRGKRLAVDYNYRFMPAFATLKSMIDRGDLGRIAALNVHAHSYCVHHAIDLVRFLGGEVVDVAAMHTWWDRDESGPLHEVGDLVYCPTRNAGFIMRFANGAVATISGSLHMDLRNIMLTVDVVGDQGRATVDDVRIDDVVGRLTVYPEGRVVPVATDAERAQGFSLAFNRSIESFIDHVRRGTPPSPSGIDGLRAVEIEEAVVRSQRERTFVPLPRLAVGTLAFSKQPLEQALAGISQLGVPYVDVGVHEGWAHFNPSDVASDVDGAATRLKKACDATGLTPISFNVGFGTDDSGVETSRMVAVARLAQKVGVSTVTVPGRPKGTSEEDEIQRLKSLVDAARPFGVTVTVETHVGQTTEDPEVAARLCQAVPGLGLTLDPSHYYVASGGASVVRYFETVLPFVRHVHLRDSGLHWDAIQMSPGTGHIDFAALVTALRRHGYTGDYVVEYIDTIGHLNTAAEAARMKALFENKCAGIV